MIDPSIQVVNILLALPFKAENIWKSCKQYYLPILKIKDYNAMVDGRNFFNFFGHSIIYDDLKTHDNFTKIENGQGDDYTTRCLLDYPYFKKCYKLIAIDLSKRIK